MHVEEENHQELVLGAGEIQKLKTLAALPQGPGHPYI